MKLDRQLFVLATLAILPIVVACTRTDESNVKDLKAGLLVGERTLDPKKSQALIYYANNPVPTSIYQSERAKIIAYYKTASLSQHLRREIIDSARERFENDFDLFDGAVTNDIMKMQQYFCKKDANIGAGAIFITNSGVINKDISYCLPNGEIQKLSAAQLQKFTALYAQLQKNPIYNHSPLSHLDMLNAALDVSAEIFPSSKFEYSLVLKSHGSDEMVITPKIGYESSIVSPKFISSYFTSRPATRAIANVVRLDKDGLDKDGLDKDGLDKDGLDKDGLDKEGLEKDGLDSTQQIITNIRAAGVSKYEFLSAIVNPQRGMFFNVVFLESCKSDLGMLINDLAESSVGNVGYLFMSDEKGLSYTTLDWSAASKAKTNSLRAWLTDELNRIAAKAK